MLGGTQPRRYHGRTLLQEFFDGTALADQLVAAYLPGMDIYEEEFETIPLCKTPEENGCVCTWMTYAEGHRPSWLMVKHPVVHSAPLCVNPISWHVDSNGVRLEDHLGSVLPNFRPTKPGTIRCKVASDGVLEVTRPQMLGGKLLDREDWHEGDFNLFWFNVEGQRFATDPELAFQLRHEPPAELHYLVFPKAQTMRFFSSHSWL